MLRILYQPYKFIVFIPALGILTFTLGISAVALAFLVGEKTGSLCGVIWARLLAWITPMQLTVNGKENIDKHQSYVVVSNHQSQYDIFALYGWLGVDFKWVMKMELRKVPILGLACEKLGHIYIDRSNTQAALDSINMAKQKIIGGTSVLFFPEGSRSRDGKLRNFKKGAFKMAFDLDIPILPVTIKNTRNILPSDTMDLFPGRASMTIHKPISIKGFNDSSLPELMQKVKETIQSGL
ncbi:1-acyl-sn-glycerol-3-phosphate acyltransferase [bacterium]|nr:1-acyl-sn-glycerol-3-phosphate acyltransferase [bacterium]